MSAKVTTIPGMHCSPFDQPGQFWRGNLHTHTNQSDGAFSPMETCQLYQQNGYDFVAITDHFRPEYSYPITDTKEFRTPDFTTIIGAELHAPATELGYDWHIVAVGLPLDFAPPPDSETGPQIAARARAAGAFVGIAHPAASLLTLADAKTIEAAHAAETYNSIAAWEDRGDSWHLYDLLLIQGWRINAYAADDNHCQPQDPPGCTAWVNVRAETLDPTALLNALKAGHYYSSTGPEIHDIQLVDNRIKINCSPASRIIVTGGTPGKQVCAGESITHCELPIEQFRAEKYVRLTVVDSANNRAWSNPIWLN